MVTHNPNASSPSEADRQRLGSASLSPRREAHDHEAIKSKYHDQSLYQPLLLQFGKSLTERLAELENAMERRDWPALGQSAHKLKGAASSYGYPMLMEIAGQLEDQAESLQAGANAEELLGDERGSPLLSALATLCQRICLGIDETTSPSQH